MKYLIYQLLQCTWGILQTLSGLILFLYCRTSPHSLYHGAILTRWAKPGGISLGLFIFAPEDADSESFEKMAVHEYGHTVQSLVLGPLYLPVVGTLSFLWCNLPYFRRLRQEKKLSYTSFFVERQASKAGERILGKPAI